MNYDKIDELYAKLKSLRPLTQGELKRLRDEFIIESTYNSNAIEGSTMTLRETALIIEQGITIAQKPLKEHLEVIGYKDAFNYITELAEAHTHLKERDILDIHSLVLMNDSENKGKYRTVPVQIIGSKTKTTEPHMIQEQMQSLLSEYKDLKANYHTIGAISLFHLLFENIHPFIDGNGRTGRLLLNLELIKTGLLPINIKFSDKIKYYDCFDEYSETGSHNALTELIYNYEIEELEKIYKHT